MKDVDVRSLSWEPGGGNPWFYFDPDYYAAQCVRAGILPPLGRDELRLKHYFERGVALQFSPNPLFDEQYYRHQNPEISFEMRQGRWASGFDHYLRHGVHADLSPTWFFDARFYKNVYPDIRDDELRALGCPNSYAHYLQSGIGEHRVGHWTVRALRTCKSLSGFPTGIAELVAFLKQDFAAPELLAPVFDYAWMREKYEWGSAPHPDRFVAHYLCHVKAQALSPSAYFDEVFYLAAGAHVRDAIADGFFICGYEHFLAHGMEEWRRPCAAFDADFYFAANMADEVEEGAPRIAPFVHFLRHRAERRLPISPPLASLDIPEEIGKGLYERRCRVNAARLGQIDLPVQETPDVSVILIARDNYEQTANAILTVAFGTTVTVEFIVFDNGSTDDIRRLSGIQPAIRSLRAEQNLGYTVAVNRAVAAARGRVLLLLNNDVEVAPQALDQALATLDADPAIGAVGAKIIRMHGQLQEAGSLIWRDGSCLGYGRDTDPLDGQVSFLRDVDFCSTCFLLIRTADWKALGGFDEAFAPAYYEDADLCVRVWGRGQRVVYDPRVVIWHFEYGSSAIPEEALALMRRNQRRFVARNGAFLDRCLLASGETIERARLRHSARPRVLFIEDQLPDHRRGAGFGRAATIVEALGQSSGLVSVLGLHARRWPDALPLDFMKRNTELLSKVNYDNLERVFRDRVGLYDVLWISRTHNLAHLREWRRAFPAFFAEMRIVLDTEAIAAARRYAYAQQTNYTADLAGMVREELADLEGVSTICVVGELDRMLVATMLAERKLRIPVAILGASVPVASAIPVYKDTSAIVLAGSYPTPDGPNADGLLWFDREIRPLLSDLSLTFVIAGYRAGSFVKTAGLQHDYDVQDSPADMAEVFASARVMVAPTRFAAGIPMKVHDAASRGVPVVMTEMLAAQLGWQVPGIVAAKAEPQAFAAAVRELATSEGAWRRTQAVQLKLVGRDCDPDQFARTVKGIVAGAETVSNVVAMRNPKRRARTTTG